MKIRMTRSYEMWESYEPIEINPELKEPAR